MKKSAKSGKTMNADGAKRVAIEFCLFHYPTLYTGGVPRRQSPNWIVPVMLEDPEAGISSEVGQLEIDAATGKVIASTSAESIVAAGSQCYRETNHARRPARTSAAKK